MKRRDFLKLAAASAVFLNYSCKEQSKIRILASSNEKSFEFFEAQGSYKDIGIQIGKATASNLHAILDERAEWFNDLMNIMESSEGKRYSDRLLEISRNVYPQYINEIEGMAEGADLEFDQMWAMSIKNELASFKGMEPGCSTIYYKDDNNTWMFHNEDGDVSYLDRLFVVKGMPTSGVNFISLIYPGLIAGVGPSFNSNGVCQSTNFIGCMKPGIGIPRYFLGRAVLESKNMIEAVGIASKEPRAFPWNHNILSFNYKNYASVETLPDGTQDISYIDAGYYIHTNHTLGKKTEKYADQDLNYKETSSMPRIRTLRRLVSDAVLPAIYPEKFLRFLGAHKNRPYSPCRHPEGDVRGQTLATAFFDANAKTMRIYKGNPCKSVGKELYSEYSF